MDDDDIIRAIFVMAISVFVDIICDSDNYDNK